MNIENLKQIGSEWQKAGRHRIYFNGLAARWGIKTWRYNTGNICGAEFRGESISNNQAKKIIEHFMGAKLYYDMADGQFYGSGLSGDEFSYLTESIKTESEQM
ncbi:MAG: hypothetical protein R3A44_44275 [Caldilineaceae bacterium]